MIELPRDFSHLISRPPEDDRLFHSPVIEQVISDTAAKIHDEKLRHMFEQCLPNTLDTTVNYHEDADGNPDTVVITGDIPAMWLRDSNSQLRPYLRYVNREQRLQKMFAGLIFRQASSILVDPYANAFVDPYVENPPKTPHWAAGDEWHSAVWERKYELDSLAAFFDLSDKYHKQTGDLRPFDNHWLEASVAALDVIRSEQSPLNKDTRRNMHRALMPNGEPFPAVQNRGYGHPSAETGMSRTLFRPSDDESLMPFLVPANAMAVVAMTGMARVLHNISEPQLAREFLSTAHEIDDGIKRYGTITHEKYGDMYAYEVDGRGGQILMDDPNVPSLLGLPYLGYAYAETPKYQATRKFILSSDNPYWAAGTKAEGITSPHVGEFDMAWPIGTIMRIMTSSDDSEIRECLRNLRDTDAGTLFMHEAIDVDNSDNYSRPWFGWANSLFGEMILDLADRKPDILASDI